MTDLKRGDVINLYRIISDLGAKELAYLMDVSITNVWQTQSGWRQGGDEFWRKFEKTTGVSRNQIDKWIARNNKRTPQEIIQKIIKS